MRKIRKIQLKYQKRLDKIKARLLYDYDKRLSANKIKGYVTDTVRGYSYRSSHFTVPEWAHKREKDYFTYYVAHELSHQMQYRTRPWGNHDELFYKIFMKMCPKNLQHFELKYKKTCKKYGIREK